MDVDRKALGQLVLRQGTDQAAHHCRVALAQVVDEPLASHVEPARQPVGELVGQHAPEAVGDRVLLGQRHHVARRALKHRDVLGLPSHRRNEGDRGGSAADHHDALAGVVEVLRPVLRMDDPAGEVLVALEVRAVTRGVVVVAGGGEEHPAGQPVHLVAVLHPHRPASVPRGPVGSEHLVPEADVLTEAVLLDGLAEIGEDLVGPGDGVVARPRLELVAEGVEVGVRADPGEAEQVPGPADRLARLEDREGPARQPGGQVTSHPDPGDPRADDQNIEVHTHRPASSSVERCSKGTPPGHPTSIGDRL